MPKFIEIRENVSWYENEKIHVLICLLFGSVVKNV